jgi:hypothetical protein
MNHHESEWQRFLVDCALERAVDQIAREAATRHVLFTVDTMPAFVAEERARYKHVLLQGRTHSNPAPEAQRPIGAATAHE